MPERKNHADTLMLTKEFFGGRRVTVMGLGLNGGGASSVRFLAKCGAGEIVVTDIKPASELAPSLELLKDISNVTYVLGKHRPEDFVRTDMVIVNPGVAWTNPYVKLALENGVPVEMDASLFFRLCERPVIGVTGTKGKTTTSTLLAEMLGAAGERVVRVGISQVPVLDALDELDDRSVAVFELSSWRLSSLGRLGRSPHVAVFTNIYPDHLNYYGTMEAYVRDKRHICEFQGPEDWLVFNYDDARVAEAVDAGAARRIAFSRSAAPAEERGVYVRDGSIFARMKEGCEERIVGLSKIRMLGEHNVGNILAAVGAALAFGVPAEPIRRTLETFSGVPHRLEFVREKDGVKYYNDTAATVPEAAVSALSSFGGPVVLIAGGNNKGLEFSMFGEAVARKAKHVVFLKGEATERLLPIVRAALPEERKDEIFPVVGSMAEAVGLAAKAAAPGDVVLLSPGATSFGLFKNEFDRGEQFRAEVEAL
jgi:UDP-N-acetylmuramoylalanine--D-glutamate ligase